VRSLKTFRVVPCALFAGPDIGRHIGRDRRRSCRNPKNIGL
jgi:hypothetical protein